ncbi:MAG TPA: hypothetical protein VJQ54_20000 [Candidatus Sulfotelmatobacter sp.]|nr:hypothetical protein [Candidatus Sulfotelmatobacter sp.]
MRLLWCSLVCLGLLVFDGCGERGLTSSSLTSPTAPLSSPSASSAVPSAASAADLSSANVVTVNAGARVSGVDIVVAPPAGAENAIALGTLSDGFAANTGVIVHQASTNTMVLFGAGLSGDMQVNISGPQDIGVSNIRSVQAKDGTPGVAFDTVIGATTALGARTVYLKSSNNDVTAFAGGLEVQP